MVSFRRSFRRARRTISRKKSSYSSKFRKARRSISGSGSSGSKRSSGGGSRRSSSRPTPTAPTPTPAPAQSTPTPTPQAPVKTWTATVTTPQQIAYAQAQQQGMAGRAEPRGTDQTTPSPQRTSIQPTQQTIAAGRRTRRMIAAGGVENYNRQQRAARNNFGVVFEAAKEAKVERQKQEIEYQKPLSIADSDFQEGFDRRVDIKEERLQQSVVGRLPDPVVRQIATANEQLRFVTKDIIGGNIERTTGLNIKSASRGFTDFAMDYTVGGRVLQAVQPKAKEVTYGIAQGVGQYARDKPLRGLLMAGITPGLGRGVAAAGSVAKSKAVIGAYTLGGYKAANVARITSDIAGVGLLSAGVGLSAASIQARAAEKTTNIEKGMVYGEASADIAAASIGNMVWTDAKQPAWLRDVRETAAIQKVRSTVRTDPKYATPENIKAVDDMAVSVRQISRNPTAQTMNPTGEPNLNRAVPNPSDRAAVLKQLRQSGDTLGGSAGQSAYFDKQTAKLWKEVATGSGGNPYFTGQQRTPKDLDIVTSNQGAYPSSVQIDFKSYQTQVQSSPFARPPVQTPSGVNVYPLSEQVGRKFQGLGTYRWSPEATVTPASVVKNYFSRSPSYTLYRAPKDFYGNIPNIAVGESIGAVPQGTAKALLSLKPSSVAGTTNIIASGGSSFGSVVGVGLGVAAVSASSGSGVSFVTSPSLVGSGTSVGASGMPSVSAKSSLSGGSPSRSGSGSPKSPSFSIGSSSFFTSPSGSISSPSVSPSISPSSSFVPSFTPLSPVVPFKVQASGAGWRSRSRPSKRGPFRGSQYLPSLAGLESGFTISEAPKATLGVGIRYKVKKKKSKRRKKQNVGLL